ncbi:putative MCAK-like kinesin [Leptomonas pyrrhocoris]|uniref:Kinesin-like protein n=1 Tax=Leptomonas pyrrhocoris TaxID=157538 RepID=A0A0M9FZ30_LEPPY|nr:putative MCAK-like kinesin [Leptomonas pyrrhocoris]XP_015657520.1 putative MCAK-like kinesin [Leptomonas pyrrhocoris]KPA79080.1 putative MCAK-like kinesin [Leptomonas pyrrhocoris]KPA79081.1 putative MCAK-like kinesin [Leptomonas pyrrhocoris]|eukprot:XP_015657519.1 putative MCAK-like kinesin [Leptomonas pyrrhocoris]
MSISSRICVAVRKRPIPDPEMDIVETPSPLCIVNEPKVKYDLSRYTDRHTFTYDEVFGDQCNNATIYERCCRPLVENVFNYGNATCFAYGQTGSGKTYTMLGSAKEPGLYAIAAREIFARANSLSAAVVVSFYEIYGRKIFDLLNNRERLFAREDADKVINICGLSEHQVTDIQEIFDVITAGSAYRAAGQTSANAESSRSHAVLQIEVRETKSANARRGPKTIGRISFIDLAGNERGADTFDCDRKTRMEGAEINKSLLALKECIRALGMGKSHVPFRGSILTEVLRDSFTGNSRTTMIATISPSSQHCVNTLNTLRYTQRVKDLGGGANGGAKKEQVANSPPARRAVAPRRKPFENAGGGRNRPEWVADFASDQSPVASPEEDDDSNGAVQRPAAKPRLRRLSQGRGGTPPPPPSAVKVKDPKIATIVQQHIAALQSNNDEDEDEEDVEDTGSEPPAAEEVGVLKKDEERQVRKVHAYVVEEIAKAEEKLIALHRRHIDSKMTGIKEEITAIQNFEDNDSVDEYVARVRMLLQKQRDDMNEILDMLSGIGSMLRDEEDLSKTLTMSKSKGH